MTATRHPKECGAEHWLAEKVKSSRTGHCQYRTFTLPSSTVSDVYLMSGELMSRKTPRLTLIRAAGASSGVSSPVVASNSVHLPRARGDWTFPRADRRGETFEQGALPRSLPRDRNDVSRHPIAGHDELHAPQGKPKSWPTT